MLSNSPLFTDRSDKIKNFLSNKISFRIKSAIPSILLGVAIVTGSPEAGEASEELSDDVINALAEGRATDPVCVDKIPQVLEKEFFKVLEKEGWKMYEFSSDVRPEQQKRILYYYTLGLEKDICVYEHRRGEYAKNLIWYFSSFQKIIDLFENVSKDNFTQIKEESKYLKKSALRMRDISKGNLIPPFSLAASKVIGAINRFKVMQITKEEAIRQIIEARGSL